MRITMARLARWAFPVFVGSLVLRAVQRAVDKAALEAHEIEAGRIPVRVH